MTHPLGALELTWRTDTRHDRAPMAATFASDLGATIAHVTCTSELRRPADPEWANRAALWNRTHFPQGTPCEAPA